MAAIFRIGLYWQKKFKLTTTEIKENRNIKMQTRLTPLPRGRIRGITLSRLIHWIILGAAYWAPRHDDRDEI